MRSTHAFGAVLAIVAAASVAAQRAEPDDAFAAVADGDPMELARLVDRFGDDAVLGRLRDEAPYPARLAAVRSAPFMVGPELALEPLASLAAGRHPHLAPAAAQSALTITRNLDGRALARREILPSSLAGAANGFDALAEDETARADLRVVAGLIHAQLQAAGVVGR